MKFRTGIDRLFARFRRTGDPATLAAVFDRAGPELLRVSSHLVADRHHAEDLVQTTFVTAIEQRESWDERRPVLPWLLGILANRARAMLRDERRRATAKLEHESVQADPAEHAARDEFRGSLRAHLDELREPYRQVLSLHLEQGLSAQQIAATTGRVPSTVRSQIARGLDMLRKLLPAGFAAAATVKATPAQRLANVRTAVLAHAERTVVVEAATAGASIVKWLGAAVVAGAGVWLAWDTLAEPPIDQVAEPADAARTTTATIPAEAVAPHPAPQREVIANRADPVEPELAVGTILVDVHYQDGVPASGTEVFALDPNTHDWTYRGIASTDANGRATLEVVPGDHAICLDVADARTTTAVEAGQTSRVELTIPVGLGLRGRVVDEAGRPVAGAVVRSSRGYVEGDGCRLAVSGDDGGFHARGLDTRMANAVWASAARFQPSAIHTVVGDRGDTAELELVLGPRGAEAVGQVLDLAGQPVANARVGIRVRDASAETRLPLSVLLRTDGDGRFACDELVPGSRLFVARGPGGGRAHRVVEIRLNGINEITLRLQPGATVRGVVVDGRGAPIPGADVAVSHADYTSVQGLTEVTYARGQTDQAGTFRFERILSGPNRLSVYGPPGATADRDLRLRDGDDVEVELAIVSDGPTPLEIQVLAENGVPLRGWPVQLRPLGGQRRVGQARTDESGIARFELHVPDAEVVARVQLGPEAQPENAKSMLAFMPAIATATLAVSQRAHTIVVPDAAMPSAHLRLRVVDARGQPVPLAQFGLQHVESGGRFNATSHPETGVIEIGPLPPGRWRPTLRREDGSTRALPMWEAEAGATSDLGDVVHSG